MNILDFNNARRQDELPRFEARTSSYDEKKLTAAEIAKALKGKRSGKNWSCCCPAHDDGNASLSIGDGDKGVVVRCHAGCEQDAVIDALRRQGLWSGKANGATVHNLRKPASQNKKDDPAAKQAEQDIWDSPDVVYDYTTVAGDYAYSVLCKGYINADGEPDKTFRQGIRHAASGRWIKGLNKEIPRLLYRLPELAQYPDATVFVTEGEKDADRIASLGLCATTVAVHNWNVDTSILRGRDVWILEDADVPGVKYAREAAEALRDVAKTIRIVRLPGHEFTADRSSVVSTAWRSGRLRRVRSCVRRKAALLVDPAKSLARHEATKPKPATTMTTTRLCRHEAAHGLVSYVLSRPVVRISIIPNGDNSGHAWHYRAGEATKDDLVILASGYVAEEILMGDVHEHGSSSDVEKSRTIAMRLAKGDVDKANTLLREADAMARGIVQKYSSAILKLALRLQINKELVLDIAENEIRACIEAFEKKPELDAEWQRKIAMAQARQSVREYQAQKTAKAVPTKAKGRVIREWNMANPTDAADFAKRMGLKPGSELVGHTDGYIARKKK